MVAYFLKEVPAERFRREVMNAAVVDVEKMLVYLIEYKELMEHPKVGELRSSRFDHFKKSQDNDDLHSKFPLSFELLTCLFKADVAYLPLMFSYFPNFKNESRAAQIQNQINHSILKKFFD